MNRLSIWWNALKNVEQRIICGLFLYGGLGMTLFAASCGYEKLLFIAVALVGIGVGLRLLFIRCRHCGRHLTRRLPLFASYCPYCGKHLDEIS